MSTSFLFLRSLVKMLKFTSIVGYTSCGPTYIESFLTIFGQCINVLNYNFDKLSGNDQAESSLVVVRTSHVSARGRKHCCALTTS